MTTPKTAAASHLVTSHGADFFGQDRHALRPMASLAGYAEGVLPAADRGPLVRLLQEPTAQTIPAAEAKVFAEQLLAVSKHRFVRARPSALARLLADAAGRAAADGEPWVWRVESAA